MSNETTEVDPKIESLLRDAAEWRILGLLFERPVGDWKAHLTSVSKEVTDVDLLAAANAAIEEASEGLYHATFAPSGPISLREAGYSRSMNFGQFFAQMSALYDGFAYQTELKEAPDHLAVELGFVSYLCIKQAYAQTVDGAEQAKIAADVLERFVQMHVSLIAAPVVYALQNGPVPYLALAAKVLQQRLEKYVKKFEPLPSPTAQRASEDCGSFDCGSVP